MSKITPKKYEKVNATTLRVIAEKVDEVNMTVLIKNAEVMKKRVKNIEIDLEINKEKLEQIESFIAEAKALGITEEVKDDNAQESKK